MPDTSASTPPANLAGGEDFSLTLLEVALTGFILFRPVYDAAGGAVTDLAYEYLNPAARQMLRLPQRPAESFLALFPGAGPANAADGPAAIAFWDEVAAAHDLLGRVQVVFVDGSSHGVFRGHLARRSGIRVEKPAHMLPVKTNFCTRAWRWIVERAFAWISAK